MSFYDRFRHAEDLFDDRDFFAAARVLEEILGEHDETIDGHSLTSVRELLARAYFHSAQTQRAEEAARGLLADEPTNAYAALLLARALQRASRHDEAGQALRLAAALGAPGTSLEDAAAA